MGDRPHKFQTANGFTAQTFQQGLVKLRSQRTERKEKKKGKKKKRREGFCILFMRICDLKPFVGHEVPNRLQSCSSHPFWNISSPIVFLARIQIEKSKRISFRYVLDWLSIGFDQTVISIRTCFHLGKAFGWMEIGILTYFQCLCFVAAYWHIISFSPFFLFVYSLLLVPISAWNELGKENRTGRNITKELFVYKDIDGFPLWLS